MGTAQIRRGLSWPIGWFRSGLGAKLTVGLVLLASVYGTVTVQSWMIAPPQGVTIEGLEAGADATGDRWLTVRMSAPPQPRCYRMGLHLLYRDGPDRRHYVPLSSALNGMNFAGMVTSFSLSMGLPANIEAGEWSYIQRTLFICPLWPSGVRMSIDQTAPVAINLPPTDFSAAR